MEEKKKIEDCIQLIRRLPISQMEENITAISNIIYEEDDLLNEFLQKVDNRLELTKEDGDFIKCEYNRDADSYRSPHSNKYYPPTEEGEERYPREDLRELEIKLNKMFQLYLRFYYTSQTVCSCYCWELGSKVEDGFAVAVLIKNSINSEKGISDGHWDSNNVINVTFKQDNKSIAVTYKLVSSVVLQMSFNHKTCGIVSLSGTVSRKIEETNLSKSYINDDFHIQNIGRIIEECENDLRNTIEEIYIKKSQEIIETSRYSPLTGKPNIAGANKLKEVFGTLHQ